MYFYIAALLVVSVVFSSYSMAWYWFIFGLVEVFGFFYFSNVLTKKWQNSSIKNFQKKIFATAFIIRLIWVFFSYFFFIEMTGQPFEFGAADSLVYHDAASWRPGTLSGAVQIWNSLMKEFKGGISDTGYPFYLVYIYKLFGVNVIVARIIKALLSAYTCVLIYKLASRTFDDSTARMAAIFCMLMPNLIYYCGLHLKETEMVFLVVAFMERADYAMRGDKFSFSNLVLPILLAGSLFFFRTVLGATALFTFITALIFSNKRVFKKGWKRVILIVWVLVAAGYFMGGRIATEVEEIWERRTTSQANSMEWRSQRKGGNDFAKYASASVFAPMIFVIPFPTMLAVSSQYNQQLLHGGYYVKNIMAFFAIFALLWVLKNKKWRDFTLIGAFTLGYLIVIAFSAFAHSERFHLPALPFILIMAAFGVSQATNKTKKYYMFWLAFIFVVIIAWSWFKLAGRGLV